MLLFLLTLQFLIASLNFFFSNSSFLTNFQKVGVAIVWSREKFGWIGVLFQGKFFFMPPLFNLLVNSYFFQCWKQYEALGAILVKYNLQSTIVIIYLFWCIHFQSFHPVMIGKIRVVGVIVGLSQSSYLVTKVERVANHQFLFIHLLEISTILVTFTHLLILFLHNLRLSCSSIISLMTFDERHSWLNKQIITCSR